MPLMSLEPLLYPTIDLLPVLEEELRVALATTEEELSYVRSIQDNLALFTQDFCQRFTHDYEDQQRELLLARELCVHWRQQVYLSEPQKTAMRVFENQIARLEKLTQRVLSILHPGLVSNAGISPTNDTRKKPPLPEAELIKPMKGLSA